MIMHVVHVYSIFTREDGDDDLPIREQSQLHVRTDCAKTQQQKLLRPSKTRVLRAVTFGS